MVSAVSTRSPPAFRSTATVFGPVNRPLPMTSSAPLSRYLSRCISTRPATIARLRSTTRRMSTRTGPVSTP